MRRWLCRLIAAIGVGLVPPGMAPTPSFAENYAYDSLGRLTLAVSDGGRQTRYSYDAAGNRTQVVTATGSSNGLTAADVALTASAGGSPVTSGVSAMVVGVSTPVYGTATFSGSSFTYTPPASSLSHSDIFTYTIQNADGLTASAMVRVTLQ